MNWTKLDSFEVMIMTTTTIIIVNFIQYTHTHKLKIYHGKTLQENKIEVKKIHTAARSYSEAMA